MPYGDNRPWLTSWKRIEPIPASEIGDTTAGGTSNVQQALDRMKNYRGVVADVAARNALTGLVSGDFVFVTGIAQFHYYNGSGWVAADSATLGGANPSTNADANTIVKRTASGSIYASSFTATSGFNGAGGNITGLNASNISQGTLDDARLSTQLHKRLEHATNIFSVGNNDWTSLLEVNAGSAVYSETHRGVVLSGSGAGGAIKIHMEVDPEATYYVRAKFKKIDGGGGLYVGAQSLDNNYNNLATDNQNSFNYFGAANQVLAPGNSQIYSGTISGYNPAAPTAGANNKFDPEAKYFDIRIICNYQSTGSTVLEWLELYKLPKYFRTTGGMDVDGSLSVGGAASITGVVTSTGGFSGPGGSLTGLNGTQITTGTVADTRLSTNVPLKNAANVFTQTQTIGSTVGGHIAVSSSDTYGTILFKNGGTNRAQIITSQTTGRMHFDAPGGFVVRSAVNGVSNLMEVTTSGDLTIPGTFSGSMDAASITSGTIAGARLPIATGSVLGGIKVGGGLAIDGNGVLSTSGQGQGTGTTSTTGLTFDIDSDNNSTSESITFRTNGSTELLKILETGAATFYSAGVRVFNPGAPNYGFTIQMPTSATAGWAREFRVGHDGFNSGTGALASFGVLGNGATLDRAYIGGMSTSATSHGSTDSWINFFPDGNITVGTTTNSGYKFQVNGSVHLGETSLGGTTMRGDLYLANRNIFAVNNITFNDPGPNEGLDWTQGGGNFKIYESPDDLTTNTAGNLQFVANGNRRATISTSGHLWLSNGATINDALVVSKAAEISTQETLATFTVSDDAVSKLEIINSTGGSNAFIPTIRGTGGGVQHPLILSGVVTTDTGSAAAVTIDGRTTAAAALTTRPIVSVNTYGVNKVNIWPTGDIGTVGGVTAATYLKFADTASGASPTSYVGRDVNNCLWFDAGTGMVLNTTAHFIVTLDADNNGTGGFFSIRKDSTTRNGTEIFKVGENGNVNMFADATVAGTLAVSNSINIPLDKTINFNSPANSGQILYSSAAGDSGMVIKSHGNVILDLDTNVNNTGVNQARLMVRADATTPVFNVWEDGSVESTGGITAGNGLTVSAGTVSLPNGSIADTALSSNVPLKDTANIFTQQNVIVKPNDRGLVVKSGSTSQHAGISIGRAVNDEVSIAVAANASQFFTGTAGGDSIIRVNNSSTLHIGPGTGASPAIAKLTNSTVTVDGNFTVNSGTITLPNNSIANSATSATDVNTASTIVMRNSSGNFAAGTITSDNWNTTSGEGRGIRFWGSDNYKIWMSGATNGTWGGRLESTSDYNMYFRMIGGTNRGFVFTNASDNSSSGIIAHFNASNIRLNKTVIVQGGNHLETEAIQVKANNSTKRFKIEYNETDDTLDFIYSAT